MKNVRNEVDGLLNAVLTDGDWHALNCSLKREARAALGETRRRRRLLIRTGSAAGAALLLVCVGWWLRLSPLPDRPLARAGQTSSGRQFISEEEMLAMFPAGSCVVAEVNGQKELVFFDDRKAEEGFVLASP